MKNTQVGQSSPNPGYKQDIEVIDTVNLFNPTLQKAEEFGITAIQNEDKTFTINGVSTIPSQSSNSDFVIGNCTLPAGIYTILGQKAESLTQYRYRPTAGSWDNSVEINEEGLTIVLTEEKTFDLVFSVGYGKTINNYILKPMICSGKMKKPYLPYGYIGIEQAGKNKFYANFELGTIGNDGSNQNSTIRVRSSFNEVMEKTEYTISTSNNELNVVVYYYDKNGNFLSYIDGWKILPYSFTTPENCYKIKALFKNDTDTIKIEDITEIQLELGKTISKYEPYHEPIIYPINLDGNKLTKVFSLQDTLNIYRSGKVELIKRNDYVDLSTIDEWIKATSVAEGTTRFFTYFRDISQIYLKAIISNRFKPLNWSEIYDSDKTTKNAISNITQQSRIIIRISNEIASTPAKLKEYFKNNKSYAYYQKLNSKIIELPSIDPIQLWEGTNLFRLISNIDTDYSVEYVVDKNSLTEKTTEQNVE